ncbi:MAG: hypothetical protein ACLQEQ_08800 [Nitrososphaerales archaeon]
MQNSPEESILAQEQAVTMRGLGVKRELEAEVGVGEREGTLVLTNKRLIFVCTDEKEEDLRMGYTPATPIAHLLFSDVEDLSEIPQDPANTFISISSITSATGHKGGLGKPKLEVRWTAGAREKGAEFTEVLTGKRKKNLNDLAAIIQRLKTGDLKLIEVPKAPAIDTLEGKIVHVLSDLQEKGIFSIEEEVEEKFKISVDPDEIQSACDKLAQAGALDRFPDSSGDIFYRKRSPLGEDDFSS